MTIDKFLEATTDVPVRILDEAIKKYMGDYRTQEERLIEVYKVTRAYWDKQKYDKVMNDE